jgi:hypothetical protein
MVFFVIELKSRAVEIAGIAVVPGAEWMKQVARNLTDPVDGFLRGAKYLIHDQDSLFSKGQLIRNVGPTNDNGADGKVACRVRLGGLLNHYHREAA